jgi:transposase
MRNDKNLALKYRLQGKSYNEITKLLGVPKSTLSGWFYNLQLSEPARQRLQSKVYEGSLKGLIKKNKQQTLTAQKNAKTIRTAASSQIAHLSKKELLLLGAGLYWGEGYKRPIVKNGKAKSYHPVSLSNSDPKLVAVFLKFLREICEIKEEKLHAGLRIYQHQNAEQLLQFWTKLTNIPKERFEKFYYGVSKSSLGKRPFNILPYGTIQIRVNSTNTYHKIMGWIEGIQNNI